MKTSSAFLLGEKSRGLLQDVAFLPKDLFLCSQACEVLGNILMRTLEQIGLPGRGSPPAQRRFRDPEIIRNPLNAAPAGHGQPHSFPFETIRETPLLVPAHRHLLHRGWLSTFARQVQIADEMHDGGLHHRLWEDGVDRIGKTLQGVDDCNENLVK
jgi:hypothetical protein